MKQVCKEGIDYTISDPDFHDQNPYEGDIEKI